MMGDRFHYYSQEDQEEEEEYYEDKEEEEEEEEAEEALSLSDLPDLHDQPTSNYDHDDTALARSSSQPQDFFEFFTDNNFTSDDHVMCSADDIIICGKLVPFKEYPYLPPNPISKNPFAEDHNQGGDEEEEERKPRGKAAATLGLRSRSESSSNLHSPKTTILTRNSRSLDYRKLQRLISPSVSNSPEMVDTNSSVKSFRKSADANLAKKPTTTRPRWAVFMFGIAKFPAEMELEDIKTRQLRRNPATTGTSLFNVPAEARRSKGSSWKFVLNVLSCKDHNSVAVTSTSFACLPQSESFA